MASIGHVSWRWLGHRCSDLTTMICENGEVDQLRVFLGGHVVFFFDIFLFCFNVRWHFCKSYMCFLGDMFFHHSK